MVDTTARSSDTVDALALGKLAAKLAEVAGSIGVVEKSGYNKFQDYSYATERDILEALRTELTSRKIFLTSSVRNLTRDAVGDKGEYLTTVLVEYTFIDGDSGALVKVQAAGQGVDKQDKGIYKALTGAHKYMLMKNFLVPTGDDPESTDADNKSTGTVSKRANASAAKVESVSATEVASTATVARTARHTRPSRFGDNR